MLEIAGGGGFRGAGEGDVLAGVHAAGEAFRPGFEHPADDLELAFVQAGFEALEKPRLAEDEANLRLGVALGAEHGRDEPHDPRGDLVPALRGLECCCQLGRMWRLFGS